MTNEQCSKDQWREGSTSNNLRMSGVMAKKLVNAAYFVTQTENGC